jgi:hypothetical protein
LNNFGIDTSGERGIRTPGPLTVNGFQDRRIRPLCHLSGRKIIQAGEFSKSFFQIGHIYSKSMLKHSPLSPRRQTENVYGA